MLRRAWTSFRTRNTAPCVRCRRPIWFGGYAPEHSHCMIARHREDRERRQARLIAEELAKLVAEPPKETRQ